MRYKPGDRVVVKPLEEIVLWGRRNPELMGGYKEHAGKVVTIRKVIGGDSYSIIEAESYINHWIDESFVGLESEVYADKRVDRGVREIEDVYTVQITDITKNCSSFTESKLSRVDTRALAQYLKALLGVDDVVVTDHKCFVKEFE